MENDRIVGWNIEQSKKEIQKNLLKDNIIIFFTRILEDSKRYRKPNFYGRLKEIYALLYPYSNEENTKSIFQELKKSDLNSKEGLILNPQEKHFITLFLKSLDEDCKIIKQEKIKLIEKDLTKLVEIYLPNSYKLLEPYILGKLISSVGGIDNLYKMPSSTIQLIGAEKAMFRHIVRGGGLPKIWFNILFIKN